MASITLSTNVEEETVSGVETWLLKAWISETSGFTEDPGSKLLLTLEAPDSTDYHYRPVLCSDLYNYPADQPNDTFPYFRRSWLYRRFSHLYQVAEFVDYLNTSLTSLAADWEALQTATPESEDATFEGGTLHISRLSADSSSAVHENGTTAVQYRLCTLTATVTDAPDSAVFVLSDDALSLERIATYGDLDKTVGTEGGNRTSSITICVNSETRETEILEVIEADLVNLASELDLMS